MAHLQPSLSVYNTGRCCHLLAQYAPHLQWSLRTTLIWLPLTGYSTETVRLKVINELLFSFDLASSRFSSSSTPLHPSAPPASPFSCLAWNHTSTSLVSSVPGSGHSNPSALTTAPPPLILSQKVSPRVWYLVHYLSASTCFPSVTSSAANFSSSTLLALVSVSHYGTKHTFWGVWSNRCDFWGYFWIERRLFSF